MSAPSSPTPSLQLDRTAPAAIDAFAPASRDDALRLACDTLAAPGLVVITGPPGSGRTHLLEQISAASTRPVHSGGGLAMLSGAPALALERATRARMPAGDLPLLAEAVYSRTRGGLLVIDDLQWCDAATLAVLPALARRLPVLSALRTPHRISEAALGHLLDEAAVVEMPELTDAEMRAMIAHAAPTLPAHRIAHVAARAGRNPLALTALSKRAMDAETEPDPTMVADPAAAAAAAIADLPRAGRTALAALGLLGRPAHPSLLGEGAQILLDAALARTDGRHVRPASPWMAEIAAGLLEADARQAMHARLAGATAGIEAARHAAAAGLDQAALAAALEAARAAPGPSARAEALLLACEVEPAHRLAAARAALAAGRPRAALAVLEGTDDPQAALPRAWAHLATGDAAAAHAALETAQPSAERDQLRLLTATGEARAALAEELRHTYAGSVDHPGLAAALAGEDPAELEAAEALARAAGEETTANWCAWTRVIALADAARLLEAEAAARSAAERCARTGAYSWQTRFLAAASWCLVLSGTGLDGLIATAQTLADHTLPAVADTLVVAAIALAEADTGALGAARARLARLDDPPAALAALISWLEHETAWLDGQPGPEAPQGEGGLVGGLAHITGRWIAYDTGTEPLEGASAWPAPVQATLKAWDEAKDDAFAAAADAWDGLAAREQVRCLLALAAHSGDPGEAIAALERAETVAEDHGLTVLAGRARRSLRRHDVRRDRRSARGTGGLTDRECEVLRHVASGHPSRRIAEILGITAETVETHIRSGMRKLGAKTRTEAAVLLDSGGGAQ